MPASVLSGVYNSRLIGMKYTLTLHPNAEVIEKSGGKVTWIDPDGYRVMFWLGMRMTKVSVDDSKPMFEGRAYKFWIVNARD